MTDRHAMAECARSSTDRASDYGSEGWAFESPRAHSRSCWQEAVLGSGGRLCRVEDGSTSHGISNGSVEMRSVGVGPVATAWARARSTSYALQGPTGRGPPRAWRSA